MKDRSEGLMMHMYKMSMVPELSHVEAHMTNLSLILSNCICDIIVNTMQIHLTILAHLINRLKAT